MPPEKDVEKNVVLKDTQARAESLSQSQRILIVAAVCFAQFLGLLDQTSVNTAVPTIARSLGIGSSISWVASSFLAASTSTQLIIGRVSDIFGRKTTIIGALCLVMFGELMNGFAKNEIWLYSCRAVAGFGAGSLGSQAQVVVTDVTTMKQRGKYFGIVGTAVALGNGLGPVIGGVLAQDVSWRWVFWIIPPLCATSIAILLLILPGSGRSENIPARLKMVDWFGVFMTLAGTFLLLVPISEGGSTFAFNSPEFVTLLIIGLLVFAVLFVVEWKWIKLPVVALYLFGQGYGVNVFLWQNAGIGWIYFGNLYFTPQYLQNVKGFSPSRAGVLLLPLVLTHGVCSAISGNAVSRSGRYLWAIVTGTILWTVGLSCQAGLYNQDTSIVAVALIGICQGIGVGFCLQNNMVGILAHTFKRDRAVATALRQFIRGVTGAIGIAVSNAILSSRLRSDLHGIVPDDLINSLSSSIADLSRFGLNDAQQRAVRDSYMGGVHTIFLTYAPIMGVMLLAMIPLRDTGLKQKDEAANQDKSGTSTRAESEATVNELMHKQSASVEKSTGIQPAESSSAHKV